MWERKEAEGKRSAIEKKTGGRRPRNIFLAEAGGLRVLATVSLLFSPHIFHLSAIRGSRFTSLFSPSAASLLPPPTSPNHVVQALYAANHGRGAHCLSAGRCGLRICVQRGKLEVTLFAALPELREEVCVCVCVCV